jgi:hypothetical protein
MKAGEQDVTSMFDVISVDLRVTETVESCTVRRDENDINAVNGGQDAGGEYDGG